MINKIRNHYKKTFVKHGPSSLGVDWKNEDQSLARHNTFYNLLYNVNNKKIYRTVRCWMRLWCFL